MSKYKIEDIKNTIINGQSIEVLKRIPDGSIDCSVSSPPYWGLRTYCDAEWQGGDPKCEHKEAKVKSRFDYEVSEIQQINKGSNLSIYDEVCPKCGAVQIKSGELGQEDTFDEYIHKLCDIYDEIYRVLKPEGSCWVNLGDTYMSSGSSGANTIQKNSKHNQDGTLDKAYTAKKNDKSLKHKSLCNIPFRFSIEMQNPNWTIREDLTDEEKKYVYEELIKNGCV